MLINVPYLQNYGTTALMLASKGGHVDLVKQLLAAGANIHAQNQVITRNLP